MHENITIPSADGTELQAHFYPGTEPRGMLIISHGLGEHSACYDAVARSLADRPGMVDVLTFDYRGHGQSPGRRGFVRRYDDFVDDLDGALAWCGARKPDLPRYVLGHSNGGQVALHAARRDRNAIAGLILSNPSLRVSAPVPRHKYLAGLFLRHMAPRVTLASTVLDEHLTRDPVHLAARKGDPLRHGRISAPLFFGMVEGGARLIGLAPTITVPILVLLGAADPVVDAATTRAFFDRLGGRDKTLRSYPGMLHEPLNDIGREAVLADLTDWLAARLDATRTPAGALPHAG